MDIEIKIGRSVEGAYACRVPSTFNRVSRDHAVLHWHNGIATLEDNGSSNGTYVNGNRITKTQIHENDIVWLGGLGTNDQCYKLDVKQVFASCREVEKTQHFNNPQQDADATNRPPKVEQPKRNEFPRQDVGANIQPPKTMEPQRTDYTKEFEQIKQTYIDYHKELSKIKNKTNKKMQLPRLLLSLIPALLGMIFMFVLGFGSMGYMAMMIGSVLSGLIGTLTMGKNNSRQEKMAEDILDLQLKYQKEYKCPKCGKEYSLDLHWKKLQADGKCPYGCGAKFV